MGSNVTINAPASIVELETNLCEDCSFTIIEKAPIRTFSYESFHIKTLRH